MKIKILNYKKNERQTIQTIPINHNKQHTKNVIAILKENITKREIQAR